MPRGASNPDDNVRVAVRCRPLNRKEQAQGFKVAVKMNTQRGTAPSS
jgi:hypothetical protein